MSDERFNVGVDASWEGWRTSLTVDGTRHIMTAEEARSVGSCLLSAASDAVAKTLDERALPLTERVRLYLARLEQWHTAGIAEDLGVCVADVEVAIESLITSGKVRKAPGYKRSYEAIDRSGAR
jgi:hypothetical protein